VVPRDVAVAVLARPTADLVEDQPVQTDAVLAMAMLVQRARDSGLLGVLDSSAQLTADVVASLPLLRRYACAAVLLEARARRLDSGGHRLALLRGALVFDTKGDDRPITRRIQDLLNLYTDRERTTIMERATADYRMFAISDKRLPDWCVIAWGEVGDCFVVALGPDAFADVARAILRPQHRLRSEDGFARAYQRVKGPSAQVGVYVDLDRLFGQLRPEMGSLPERIAAALGLPDTQRALWAVGRNGRAIEAACWLWTSKGERLTPITLAEPQATKAGGVIPPGATKWAVLDSSDSSYTLRIRNAYLESRSESSRRSLRRLWDTHVAAPGWSFEEDFVGQLGDWFIVHDAPEPLLPVPLLCTIVVPINGSSQSVRASIDRVLTGLQQYLEPRPDDPDRGVFAPTVHRAPDGVWYLQLGLMGPALTVRGKWLVISHAPEAVRRNVRFLTGDSGISTSSQPAKP
jgi:hypothetical protein